MPFNGSGTYSAPSLPGTWNPATSGSTIDPTDWNALLTDLATALSKQICNDGQTTITANIPFATRRITGLGNPIGAQDAVTLSYLQSTPWSYLGGLTTSRASATTLGVAAGFAVDSTNLIGIPLATAMTKSTAGAWASGNNSNGMGNGLTIANATWYHVFAIINTGVADVYFDTSVTAANKPTGTTAFRRVGSFKTNGSAQILAYTQIGDRFLWAVGISESIAGGTTTLIGVPPGVITTAILQATIISGAGNFQVAFSAPGAAASIAVFINSGSVGGATVYCDTDTTPALVITYTGTAAAGSTNASMGWIDSRGKNA